MLCRLVFTLILSIAYSTSAWSSSLKRNVSLELENVEGATLYEIELYSKQSKKTQSFKLKTPKWRASVISGHYNLRMRSYDRRQVPGPWSEETPFIVSLPNPKLITPAQLSKVLASQKTEAKVEFNWEKIPGAKKYTLKITNNETQEEFVKNFDTNRGNLDLPVAQNYSWQVLSIDSNDVKSESSEEYNQFSLIGAEIEKPKIETPEDMWVQSIKWSKPNFAEKFTYILQKKSDNNTWIKILANSQLENEIPFLIEYPGGLYRISVKAEGRLRAPSKIASLEFDVFSGDRSPAAVQESKLRYSLEKPTPWYFIASYFITSITYSGVNPEAGAGRKLNYNATGGTGRLGLGYIHPTKNSGFLGILDLSGFTVDTANVTYSSAELHYVKKYSWGRNLFRPSAGLFYKELVETYDEPAPSISGIFAQRKVSYYGPHIGFDLWRPLTAKLGIQTNFRLYSNMLGGETPSGGDIEPQITYQFGLLGSYKLNKNITGFAGWARRIDSVKYDSKPADGGNIRSPIGAQQEIQISGDYLNLLLEWAF